MKKTGECPKCSSSEILKIPGKRGYRSSNDISLGMTVFSSVYVTRYLCAQCGFSEEWVDSASDLQKVREKYGK